MPETKDPNELIEIVHKDQDESKIEVFGTVTRAAFDETWKAKGWKPVGDSAPVSGKA